MMEVIQMPGIEPFWKRPLHVDLIVGTPEQKNISMRFLRASLVVRPRS
jgi:hypothetical protein